MMDFPHGISEFLRNLSFVNKERITFSFAMPPYTRIIEKHQHLPALNTYILTVVLVIMSWWSTTHVFAFVGYVFFLALSVQDDRYYSIGLKFKNPLLVHSIDCEEIGNRISEIGKCKNLKQLRIRKASTLPEFPRTLENLKLIRTPYIPPSGRLEHLTRLWLHDCNLKTFPLEILECKNLIELHLAMNAIRAIPIEICELNKLEMIDMNLNPIYSVQMEILDMPKLEHFYVYYARDLLENDKEVVKTYRYLLTVAVILENDFQNQLPWQHITEVLFILAPYQS